MSIIKSNMTAPPPPTGGSLSSISEMNSLRFDGSSYLSRTPSGSTSETTWTWSGWVKRSKLGTRQYIGISSSDSSGGSIDERNLMRFNEDNTLTVGFNPSANTWYWYQTKQVFRDTSAFMHFVVSVHASTGPASEKVKIYVNGVRIPQSDYSQFATSLNTTFINKAYKPHALFAYVNSNYATGFEGYAASIHFIDGKSLDANAFGEEISGVWVPKQYDPATSGAYGNHGFHLDFADSGNIGNDVSGRGNHWTVN